MIRGQQQFLAMQDGRIPGEVIVDPFHAARREVDDGGRLKRGKWVVKEMRVGQEGNPVAGFIDFYDVKVSVSGEPSLCYRALHLFTKVSVKQCKRTDVEIQVSLDSFARRLASPRAHGEPITGYFELTRTE